MAENKRDLTPVAEDLKRVLASPVFLRSERLSKLLQVLAERAIHQPDETRLKEIEIGVMLYGRRPDYDPKLDSIVRVEATRLRKKLKEYYDGPGIGDPVRLIVPPGRYEVEFKSADVSAPMPLVVPEPRNRFWLWWRVGLSIAGVTLVAAILYLSMGRPVERPASILPFTSYTGSEERPAVSPDGRSIAFTWDHGGVPRLYVQRIGEEPPLPVTDGSAPEYESAWSPDGRQIAFLRMVRPDLLELRRIDYPRAQSGETPIGTVRFAPGSTPGLSWSRDGEWLATAEANGDGMNLVLFSARTGQKKLFWTAGLSGRRLRPAFSPDGRYLAYIKSLDVAVSDVAISPLPSGPEREITHDRAVVNGLAWMADSRAVVVASQRARGWSSLWLVGVDGGEPRRLTESGVDSVQPSSSWRGGPIAFSRRTDDINIWRVPADGSAPPAVWIASSALDSSPQYSPDGSKIAFRTSRTGTSEIWTSASDGTGLRRLTTFNSRVTGSPQWSPDGRWIAFDSRDSGNAEVYIVPADGGTPRNLTAAPSNEFVPTWSRDGNWVYFTSDRTGAPALWRQPAAGGPAEFVRAEGIRAAETEDGRFLYYAHGEREGGLFRAPLAGGPEELVVPSLKAVMWGAWSLSGNTVYYVDYTDERGHRTAELLAFDLASHKHRRVCPLTNPVAFDSSLGVSHDGKWILFSRLDRTGSDIFLLELPR
jgi:Tol biopolymer transport system component